MGAQNHLPTLSPYLGAGGGDVRTALRSAGQGQRGGQFTLGDGPGSGSSTVPQGGWAGAGCAARGRGPGALEKGGPRIRDAAFDGPR